MPIACRHARTPADRLTLRRAQISVAACLLLFLFLGRLVDHLDRGPLRIALAAFAGLAFAGELIAFAILAYTRFDEFQRILLVRSFLWATAITAAITTAWGYLELSLHGQVPHLPFLAVPAALILLTTAAKVLVFRSNRALPESDEAAQ